MSVITKSKLNDQIVIVGTFEASEVGKKVDPTTIRTFHMGEVVDYKGIVAYDYKDYCQTPWLIKFSTSDGKHYTGNKSLFMTQDKWKEKQELFIRQEDESL